MMGHGPVLIVALLPHGPAVLVSGTTALLSSDVHRHCLFVCWSTRCGGCCAFVNRGEGVAVAVSVVVVVASRCVVVVIVCFRFVVVVVVVPSAEGGSVV